MLEGIIEKILETEAPMSVIQQRSKYNNWISIETKARMLERDLARELARVSQSQDDWLNFKILRNQVTTDLRKDRSNFLKEMYERIEKERDSAKLHSLTRNLLGWKNSGPPARFISEGKTIIKPIQIAVLQARFYEKKVLDIKANLPQVRDDPLKYLRKAFEKWSPVGGGGGVNFKLEKPHPRMS